MSQLTYSHLPHKMVFFLLVLFFNNSFASNLNLTDISTEVAARPAIAGSTGLWLLNENSGSRAKDQSANHINLVLNRGAKWRDGRSSPALSLNGINQDASTPRATLLQNPSITLSAWINPQPTQKNWEWVASQSDNFGLFLLPHQKKVVFYIRVRGDWAAVESPRDSFKFNRWQQVTGSFNSVTRMLTVYVDGKFVASNRSNQDITYDTGNGFSIGSMRHQRFYKGRIDEVQVFGTALSPIEIRQLAGKSGQVVSPVKPTPTATINQPKRFPASYTVKIMPLGDSITDSINERPSYRRALWFRLQNAGYNVDFVGNNNNTDYVEDYDIDHEGHAGWEAGDLEYNMAEWLNYVNPDIVMLHIGTNDLSRGQSDESTLDEIDGIIRALREKNSSVIILLAKLIPMRHYDTAEFNARIDGFAAARTSSRSPIMVVDQYSGFNAEDDLYDSFHPNEEGEKKMSNLWFNALQQFLQ